MLTNTRYLQLEGEADEVLAAIVRSTPGLHTIQTGGGMAGAAASGFAAALEAHHVLEGVSYHGTGVSVGFVNQTLAAYRLGLRLTSCYCTEFCTERFIRSGLRAYLDHSKIDIRYYAAVLRSKLNGAQPHHATSSLQAVVTNFETGEAAVLTPELANTAAVAKAAWASAHLPIVGKGYVVINGVPYTDGCLSDPLPIKAALLRRPRYLLVHMTAPETVCVRSPKHWQAIERLYSKTALKHLPAAVRSLMLNRHERFQAGLTALRQQLQLPLDHPDRVLPPTLVVWPTSHVGLLEQRPDRITKATGGSYQGWWELLGAAKREWLYAA